MKELKILMLVVTLGFGTSLTATTKFQGPLYPNSVKGGLQTSQKHEPGKLNVSDKEEINDHRIERKLKTVKILSRCNKN